VSGSGISWAICKFAPRSRQITNHASTPPLSFLQAVCPSCHPTNSVKALNRVINRRMFCKWGAWWCRQVLIKQILCSGSAGRCRATQSGWASHESVQAPVVGCRQQGPPLRISFSSVRCRIFIVCGSRQDAECCQCASVCRYGSSS